MQTELIVIEEELLLTVDFAHYMNNMLPVRVSWRTSRTVSMSASCLPLQILRDDEAVFAVSAWNDNAFKETASLPELAYRTARTGASLLAFMMRRSTFERYMTAECCSRRAWDTWTFPDGESTHRNPSGQMAANSMNTWSLRTCRRAVGGDRAGHVARPPTECRRRRR